MSSIKSLETFNYKRIAERVKILMKLKIEINLNR